jgi:hypothetical protein
MSAFPSLRRLDHLVQPFRDLDAGAAFWHRLGFTVGARNRHPWGTENRIVQFDGTFLELIAVGEGSAIPPHGPRAFSFGRHVADHLAAGRQGMSMLVLDSADAAADAATFARNGIGDFEPFSFERKGVRPDGSAVHVAFSLAFARSAAMPDPAFFVCQQHFPEAFWNPAAQVHPNGVNGVRSVALVAPDRAAAAAFVERFAGGKAAATGDGFGLATRAGRIDLLSPEGFAAAFGHDPPGEGAAPARFAAVTFGVADLAALASRLAAEGVPHRLEGPRAVIPSDAAHGLVLAFEEAAADP